MTSQLTAIFMGYRNNLLFTAVTTVVLSAFAYALYRAMRDGRVERWLSALAWIAAFGFSAEGMWYVTTQKAHVPTIVAAGVFFVAEAMMLSSMVQARRRYTLDGHPGKHGRAVWTIACAMGLIVAFAANNWPERLLRLAIPLGAALQWWNSLTDAGMTRPQGRWRWTPSRLLERVGAIEAATDRDLSEVTRQRRITALVACELRRGAGTWPNWWHARRLTRLAMAADPDMVADAAARLDQVRRIRALLSTPQPLAVSAPVLGEVSTSEVLSEDRTAPLTEDLTVRTGEDLTQPLTQPLTEDRSEVIAKPSADPSPSTSPDIAPKLPPTAVKVIKLRAQRPAITQREAATKLGVSVATVQRYWKAEAPTKTNGHAVPELLPAGSTP
jgi:hypothetical protein